LAQPEEVTVATWTQAEIDALRAAVASGVLQVVYDGPPRRSVTYQSLDAMRSLLATMERATAAPPAYRLAQTKKGF
jgi:hypothetical protein